MTSPQRRTVTVAVLALAWAEPAAAYVGPGAGLTVIGAALALIAAIALMVVGFVWYPLKRLVRMLRRKLGTSSE